MSRATVTYILMLVVFAAGLWLILNVGSLLLRAPTDLSGHWELRLLTEPADSDKPAVPLTIQQSGRYFSVALQGQPHPRSLKLVAEKFDESSDRVEISLAGDDMTLVAHGRLNGSEYLLKASGAIQGEWNALRKAPIGGRNRHAAARKSPPDPSAPAHSTPPVHGRPQL